MIVGLRDDSQTLNEEHSAPYPALIVVRLGYAAHPCGGLSSLLKR